MFFIFAAVRSSLVLVNCARCASQFAGSTLRVLHTRDGVLLCLTHLALQDATILTNARFRQSVLRNLRK